MSQTSVVTLQTEPCGCRQIHSLDRVSATVVERIMNDAHLYALATARTHQAPAAADCMALLSGTLQQNHQAAWLYRHRPSILRLGIHVFGQPTTNKSPLWGVCEPRPQRCCLRCSLPCMCSMPGVSIKAFGIVAHALCISLHSQQSVCSKDLLWVAPAPQALCWGTHNGALRQTACQQGCKQH